MAHCVYRVVQKKRTPPDTHLVCWVSAFLDHPVDEVCSITINLTGARPKWKSTAKLRQQRPFKNRNCI